MDLTSILILVFCVGLILYAVVSYLRTFIAQWKRNEAWRPNGNELAKLEQKQDNWHSFRMKEGFHDEDDSKNK